jgi:hypothetical protein
MGSIKHRKFLGWETMSSSWTLLHGVHHWNVVISFGWFWTWTPSDSDANSSCSDWHHQFYRRCNLVNVHTRPLPHSSVSTISCMLPYQPQLPIPPCHWNWQNVPSGSFHLRNRFCMPAYVGTGQKGKPRPHLKATTKKKLTEEHNDKCLKSQHPRKCLNLRRMQ